MSQKIVHAFVQACAWGDLAGVKQGLSMGADVVNGLDCDEDSVDGQNDAAHYFAMPDLAVERDTHLMTGVGAAMTYRQLDVLDALHAGGADFSRAGRPLFSDRDTPLQSAVTVGIRSSFWQGVDKIVRNFNVPLWTSVERPISDLLLLNIRQHHDFEVSQSIATLADSLQTFDYMVNSLGLDINKTVDQAGVPFMLVAASFMSDNDIGRQHLAHYMKMGGRVVLEAVEATESLEIVAIDNGMKSTDTPEPKSDDSENSVSAFEIRQNLSRHFDKQQLFRTTPLISCCFSGKAGFVEQLLTDKRVDPHYKDNMGHTAFDALNEGRKHCGESGREYFDRIEVALIMAARKRPSLNASASAYRLN